MLFPVTARHNLSVNRNFSPNRNFSVGKIMLLLIVLKYIFFEDIFHGNSSCLFNL